MERSSLQFGNWRLVALCACALVAGSAARAAERVELANGFSMRCDHHALVDGAIRLYADAGSENFIEVAPASVVRFERLPEQPRASAEALPQNGARQAMPQAGSRQSALDRRQLQPMLAAAGREHDLDIDLLASIVEAESANHPGAVSRTGAVGLMQLMPGTAQSLGVANAFAPEENVHGGAAYLDWLLERYHENLALALAAYNAGPAAVDRWHGMPPYRETRLYVARVIHLFNQRVRERRERLADSRAALGSGQ